MKLWPSDIRKIGVFRALQLGDVLCAIPAVRALRHAYPDAEIVLIGLPWASCFTDRFPTYFDRFIHFPGYEGLPEQDYDPRATRDFIAQMQSERFDLLLQMQGNGSIINTFLARCRPRWLAGFYQAGMTPPSSLFTVYPDSFPEPHRHLVLMQHLGIPLRGDQLEFPLTKKDRQDAERLMLPLEPGRYICVHPGSRGAWRQWPPSCFAALADQCADKGLIIVLTGTEAETEITREVSKYMRHPAIDLAGKTSLGAIAWIIKNAFALIANCTGVSHIAAAVQTPSVIISMDGEPHRWGPVNKELHKVIDGSKTLGLDQMLAETMTLLGKRTEKTAVIP